MWPHSRARRTVPPRRPGSPRARRRSTTTGSSSACRRGWTRRSCRSCRSCRRRCGQVRPPAAVFADVGSARRRQGFDEESGDRPTVRQFDRTDRHWRGQRGDDGAQLVVQRLPGQVGAHHQPAVQLLGVAEGAEVVVLGAGAVGRVRVRGRGSGAGWSDGAAGGHRAGLLVGGAPVTVRRQVRVSPPAVSLFRQCCPVVKGALPPCDAGPCLTRAATRCAARAREPRHASASRRSAPSRVRRRATARPLDGARRAIAASPARDGRLRRSSRGSTR